MESITDRINELEAEVANIGPEEDTETDGVSTRDELARLRLQLAIANSFTATLRSWLTSSEMQRVRQRNAAETEPGICHSHDFCDANMAMADAFEENGIKVDVCDETQLITWAAAWNIAKAAAFTEVTA